jgi:hypothetical protein
MHNDIVTIVVSYVRSAKRDYASMAQAGEYETFLEVPNIMIARRVNDWNAGLYGACCSGHQELVELMISRGATNCLACRKSMADHLSSISTRQ